VLNLENKILDKPYDWKCIQHYDFDEKETSYLKSKFDLEYCLATTTPLIELFNRDKSDLAIFILHQNNIEFIFNEETPDQTLFICFLDYYLSLPDDELKKNFWDYTDEILNLFANNYLVKPQDFEFVKQFKACVDPRKLQYVLFASYALRLKHYSLIKALEKDINLITNLTCIKTEKHIGFNKSIEDQVLKTSDGKSHHQNTIIDFITKHKKVNFEDLKNRLLEKRLNIYERVSDESLRSVLSRLGL
jgi:hypothetical protein